MLVVSPSTWCVLPAPLLDRLPVERVLADSTRQLVRDAALLLLLLLLSKLDLLSVATRRIETVGSRSRTSVSLWLVDATEHAFDPVKTASVESPLRSTLYLWCQ